MNLKFLPALVLSLCISSLSAQLNYTKYQCENVPGTYNDLGTNGTVISTLNQDNANSSAQNIGFSFDYNGTTFTQFVLNTNGFIRLGSAPPSSTALFYSTGNSYVGGIFNSTNAADVDLISPFNHDLINGGTTTEYRVHTSGTAGSRVCTIQYKNVKDKTTTPLNQFDSINFQIKLYETTGIIEFVYGDWFASSDSSRFKSSACGLKGSNATTTNQLVVVSKGSTQPWDAAVFLNGNYTGNACNFGNSNVGNGAGPGGSRPMVDKGRTYRFKPAFATDVAPEKALAQGDLAIPYGLPHDYGAIITNVGLNSVTAVKIYLNITGANTHQDSVTYAILNPGQQVSVSFSAFTPTNIGVNNIQISVSADSNMANNVINYRQEVGREVVSWVDTSAAPIGNVGYNAGVSGMILNKYSVSGKRRISGVEIYISDEAANIGKNVYGVVLDGTGTLLARSPAYNILAGDLNKWHYFEIFQAPTAPFDTIKPPLISNADFFVGIVAVGGANRYNPVGHNPETPLRTGAFYFLGNTTGGSAPIDYSTQSLDYVSHIKGHMRGSDLKMEPITSLTDPSCPNPAQTVDVTLTNKDSITVDFSRDSLLLQVSSTGAITQSFTQVVKTGTIAPGASQNFVITNNFDLSVGGTYNIDIVANPWLDVDTTDNYKSMVVNVVDTPDVTLTVAPDSVLCFGTPITFVALPYTAGSILYQFKVNGDNVGAPSSDSSFLPTNLVYGDRVSVDLITDHCTTTAITVSSDTILMKLNPAPQSINGITGQDTVLEFSTKKYAVGLNPTSTFKWSIVGGTITDTVGNSTDATWDAKNPNASISVEETDAQGCVYNNVLDVFVGSIVGVITLENEAISIGQAYPNPANEVITIPVRSTRPTDVQIRLFNITGSEAMPVFTGMINGDRNIEFNTSDLPEGLYFYQVVSEGVKTVRKVSVVH